MGMWVEGYSMYEKERWDEAERYGKEIGLNEGRTLGLNEGLAKGKTLGIKEGMSKGMSKGRETEKNAWITNLRNAGMSEAQIKALMPSPNT